MVVTQDVSCTEYFDFHFTTSFTLYNLQRVMPYSVLPEYENRRSPGCGPLQRPSLKVPKDSRAFGSWDWLYKIWFLKSQVTDILILNKSQK